MEAEHFIFKKNTFSVKNSTAYKADTQKNHTSKREFVFLSFSSSKIYSPKYSRKTNKQMYQDCVVRYVEYISGHDKDVINLPQKIEYNKTETHNSLILCNVRDCNICVHTSDYYIYALKKIIT